tara:strand:- start:3789 stop:4583 length:795 start_codon:yes stop_codon:yes gene_type:complete
VCSALKVESDDQGAYMTSQNSFPDICEFSVSFEPDAEDSNKLSCVVDLRVSCSEVPLGDQECTISFQRLIISVDIEGIDIIPGTRFGEPLKNNSVVKKKTISQAKTKTKNRGWSFGGSTKARPEGAASAENRSSNETSRDTHISEDEKHHRVTAKPNLRLEVIEADDDPLDGTYMEREKLFEAKTKQGGNRTAATLCLKVKQRDLSIGQIIRNESALSFFSVLTENQRRLIDIFIAKSLSNSVYGSRKYVGEIILSEFEYLHEE